MVSMTVTTGHGPFTRAELDALPDDGRRHELIDGCLVVTPSPGFLHQVVVGRLFRLLDDHASNDVVVLVAPFDVVLADDTVVEPDVLVARGRDFTAKDLPAAPLLAVEVLSPSTRRIDLHLKLARYEAAGCPAYWVVDPDLPSLTAWQLEAGRYGEVARVVGGEAWTATSPFEVTVVPDSLTRP
jgi:Uma2 family endonuclease